MVIFAGWSVLRCLDIKKDIGIGETFALSYGLGMALISAQALIIWMTAKVFSPALLMYPWIILFFAGMLNRKPLERRRGFDKIKLSGFDKFLICAISFEIIYAFFRAVIYPMESYDAVAIWGLKAKAIYFAGGLPIGFFKDMNYATAHPDYPLLVPIQEGILYLMSKGVSDALAKLIFPLYFVSFLIIFYSLVKRTAGIRSQSSRRIGLVFTFILASIPQFREFAVNGYADIVVAFYYSLGFLFAYLWYAGERKTGFLFLSAVFSVMCAWTKNEGIFLCFLNMIFTGVIFFLCARKGDKIIPAVIWTAAFYITALMIFVFPWVVFKASVGLKSDLVTGQTFSVSRVAHNLSRLPAILYEYQKQFFGFKKWNIIWIAFLIFLATNFKKSFSEKASVITASIFAVFLMYTAVYIVTPKDFLWHLSTSASRLFIHVAPLAVFWLAIIFKGKGIKL